MPVEELKTRFEAKVPDTISVYRPYDAYASQWDVAPGEGPEIVHRLELYPELVEAADCLCKALRMQQDEFEQPVCNMVAGMANDLLDILDRCQAEGEVPGD